MQLLKWVNSEHSSVSDIINNSNSMFPSVNHLAGMPLPAPMSLNESFPYLLRPSSFHLSSAFQDTNISSYYELNNSFIYESGSDTLACNHRDRFISLKPVPEVYNNVRCGDNYALMKGIGDAHVWLSDCTTKQKFCVLLKKVIFAPTFHTNIISGYQASKAGIWPDLGRGCLYRSTANKRVRCCQVTIQHRQFVLENNVGLNMPLDPKTLFHTSSTEQPVTTASVPQWHRRSSHANWGAIKTLPLSSREVAPFIPENSPCETCQLAKARKRISQVTIYSSTASFARVHTD